MDNIPLTTEQQQELRNLHERCLQLRKSPVLPEPFDRIFVLCEQTDEAGRIQFIKYTFPVPSPTPLLQKKGDVYPRL